MAALTVKDLCFQYAGHTDPVLDKISFSLEEGQLLFLCGPTGSGKSTLLRLLKEPLRPKGTLSGEICADWDLSSPFTVGYVGQHPADQVVCDKVWHELAFALENQGRDPAFIRRRVSETADFFGIAPWIERSVDQLSGGQLQLVNLASAMVCDPELLVLDEPTSQLDPVASAEFYYYLEKINRELSTTVILCEHDLAPALPLCHRVLCLDGGKPFCFEEPGRAMERLYFSHLRPMVPSVARLYYRSGGKGSAPLSVAQAAPLIKELPFEPDRPVWPLDSQVSLEWREVYYRYPSSPQDALRGFSLKAHAGEVLCMVGANGSGKSTALSLAADLFSAKQGRIRIEGKDIKRFSMGRLYQGVLAMLTQEVRACFVCETVGGECSCGYAADWLGQALAPLSQRHPFDLSGGQQQLLALNKILCREARILLLDEPTKGLDEEKKLALAKHLQALAQKGKTVVCVTHDLEFAALCAHRVAYVFCGECVSCEDPAKFFLTNRFYTTPVARLLGNRGAYFVPEPQEDTL